MKKIFNLEQEYDFEAYREYNYTIQNRIRKFKLRRYVTLGAYCFFGVLIMLMKNSASLTVRMCIGIGAVLVGVLMYFRMGYKLAVETKKSWDTSAGPEGKLSVTLDFYEDCFKMRSSKGTVSCDYKKIFKAFDTEKYYYLMIQTNYGAIIEKSRCSEELLEFLKNKISFE